MYLKSFGFYKNAVKSYTIQSTHISGAVLLCTLCIQLPVIITSVNQFIHKLLSYPFTRTLKDSAVIAEQNTSSLNLTRMPHGYSSLIYNGFTVSLNPDATVVSYTWMRIVEKKYKTWVFWISWSEKLGGPKLCQTTVYSLVWESKKWKSINPQYLLFTRKYRWFVKCSLTQASCNL